MKWFVMYYSITYKGSWNFEGKVWQFPSLTMLSINESYCSLISFSTWDYKRGTRWRSWLRHCATSRKVAGSIPDGVTGTYHWHNPSGRTMALRLYSASNRNEYQKYFLGCKGGRYVGLTTLPPSCSDCLEIWELQPPGTLWACPDL